MDLTTIRTAMANVVKTVTGRSYGHVPDQPSVPCGVVYIEQIGYADPRATWDGIVPAQFVILLLSASVGTKGGQEQLDRWVSTASNSVVYALEHDNTLSGSVPSMLVKECRKAGTRNLVDGGTRYFFAEIVVEVLAPGATPESLGILRTATGEPYTTATGEPYEIV